MIAVVCIQFISHLFNFSDAFAVLFVHVLPFLFFFIYREVLGFSFSLK